MVKKNEAEQTPAPKTRKTTKKATVEAAVEEVVETPVEAKKPTRSRKPKAEAEEAPAAPVAVSATSLLFQAPDLPTPTVDPKRGRIVDAPAEDGESHLRKRTRRRAGEEAPGDLPPNAVVKVRTPREPKEPSNEPQKVRGSTRLEAKRQRRRDGRDAEPAVQGVGEVVIGARRGPGDIAVGSDQHGVEAGQRRLDSLIRFLCGRAIGFDGRFQIAAPAGEEGVWTLSQDSMSYDSTNPTADRTVHVDQYTGRILADVKFADYPFLGKVMAVGIALHEGQLGWWNVVLNALFWVPILLFFALLKLLLPFAAAQRAMAPVLLWIAEAWISCNSGCHFQAG